MIVPGVKIQMGGKEFTVPPLTLGQLRRLMPKVQQLTTTGPTMDEAQISALVEIVTAGLQRNYPDLSAETVENLLDLGNAAEVVNAILTGSGLKPRGEAVAVAPTEAGPISTDSSPPLADTASQ